MSRGRSIVTQEEPISKLPASAHRDWFRSGTELSNQNGSQSLGRVEL